MKKYLIALLLILFPSLSLANSQATLIKDDNKVVVNLSDSVGIKKLFDGGYKLYRSLGSYAPTTGYSQRLTQSITNSSTTIYVSSIYDKNGVALPLSATNKGYFNIEAGTAREEPIFCTGVNISNSSLTGCTRGLAATGSDETGSILRAYSHNAGSAIIMSNISQFYGNFIDTSTNQTIGGIKNFTLSPLVPTPTLAYQVSTKEYVDGVSIAGAPNASTTVKGISKLSTAPASSTNPIAVGDNDTRLPTQSENDALVGTLGTPSTSNKFVTNDDTTATATASKVVRWDSNAKLKASSTNLASVAGDVVALDANAKLPALDGSQLIMPTKQLNFLITDFSFTSSDAFKNISITPNGQYMYVAVFTNSSGGTYIYRYSKDSLGNFYRDGVNLLVSNSDINSLFIYTSNNYVWIVGSNNGGSNIAVRRYALNLTGAQNITISGTTYPYAPISVFGDDTRFYVTFVTSSTSVANWTILGTTATRQSDLTLYNQQNIGAPYFDGTYIYFFDGALKKYNTSGSLVSSTAGNYFPTGYDATTQYFFRSFSTTYYSGDLAHCAAKSNYVTSGSIPQEIYCKIITKS